MENPNPLKVKKAKVIAEAQAILDKAETLTPENRASLDKMQAEAQALGDQIERTERRNNLEMSTSPRPKGLELTEQDRSFLAYARKGINRLTSDESRALVEDVTGQYLVSPAISQEIERVAEKLNIVRQLASVRTTDKDRVKIRSITEATVGWGKLETGTAITESTPTPTERTVYVEDLCGLVKIGNDELEDNDYDLAAFLADSFGRTISAAENLAFIKGAGHGSEQPDGITVDGTLVAATMTTAAANAVTIDDFLQMIYEVPVKYRQGSAFIVSSATELAIRKLRAGGSTTGDGPYMWQPSLIEGQPATFAGFPIYSQDDMASLSGTLGVIGIFGNFTLGYRILDRREIRIQRLSELYSESGLTGFICTRRVGGYVVSPSNKSLVLLSEHS